MSALSALLAAPKMVLKSKLRLYLEYALIVLLVCTAAVAFWNSYKNRLLEDKVSTQQTAIKNANDKAASFEQALIEQKDAIGKVSQLREADSAILMGLQQDLKRIGARDEAINKSIALLEKNSAEVRSYTASSVPTALACVLDKTCDAITGSGSGSGKADTAVPAGNDPATVRRPPARRK